MAIETSKNSLCINQIVGQKSDSIIIEGDAIVPDIKPDILSTIGTSGTICIYNKECMDGKVKVEGCIQVYTMYLADSQEGNVRSLNTSIDFSKIVELDKVKSGMSLDTTMELKNVECKILNGRKINIKAIMDIGIKVFSNETVEFISEIDDRKDVQLLNETVNMKSLLGTGTTKVYAKETILIDNIDNIVEVMKVNVGIVNKDTKISYNKVLAKSDFSIKIMYLTEDNRMNTIESLIPVMGFIDMPNIADDNICNTKYEVKNVIIKPNNPEEHSIYVEAEIEVACEAYENKELAMIQDLYSPTANVIFTQRKIQTTQNKQIVEDICSIREKQVIPEIQGNKIYYVEVNPSISNQTKLKDRIVYEGEVALNFLFASQNGSGIDGKTVVIPYNFNMVCNGVTSTSQTDTSIEIKLQDFVVMPDESIDVKIDLGFQVQVSQNEEINIIDEININEEQPIDTCSMIVYIVKPGDSLWKIAKRFHSTIEDIARVNNIENIDQIKIGEQLFIPRYKQRCMV